MFFPGDGVAPTLTVLSDGSLVEVATVGREGMLGVTAHRGVVRVVNRAKLEDTACECYAVTTRALSAVTGRSIRSGGSSRSLAN